jgi:hypothetical protein
MAFLKLKRRTLPKLISIEQARERHASREGYDAILMDAGTPRYVVTVVGNFLSVSFMDDCGRCYLEYDFREKQPLQVFLTHATHREFIGDSDDLSNFKLFAFHENGEIFMEDHDEIAKTVVESKTQDSVAENWDDYPQFGDYASLCREERS